VPFTNFAREQTEIGQKRLAEMLGPDSALSRTRTEVYYYKGRAYASANGREIRFSDARSYVHEMGHVLEFNDPNVRVLAQAYRKVRAMDTFDGLTTISGRADELGWEDLFFDHYVGRSYAGSSGFDRYDKVYNPTELISMGVERMYRSPADLANVDPAFFDWFVDVILPIASGKQKVPAGGITEEAAEKIAARYSALRPKYRESYAEKLKPKLAGPNASRITQRISEQSRISDQSR